MNPRSPSRPETAPAHGIHDVGVLLGVWAHPDDDAYLSAGLMALARAAGNRVVVATATRGERGTQDPVAFPPKRLAEIRERETIASLGELGVQEHRWLGHRDGGIDEVARVRGVRQVRTLIEEVQPNTIVTFGPDGMTGHSDHRAVSAWVTAAWQQSRHACRLWYATVTPEFHREWNDVNSEVGLWFSGTTPPRDPASELAFVVRCDEPTLDLKFAALRAHASQTAALIDQLGRERFRRWWSTESFIDASRHHRRHAA